jgi:hypothetical protein
VRPASFDGGMAAAGRRPAAWACAATLLLAGCTYSAEEGPGLVSSIGGSKNTGHGWSGSDGYVVRTASSGGSELVIFVLRVAHSTDLSLSFVARRRAHTPLRKAHRPKTSATPAARLYPKLRTPEMVPTPMPSALAVPLSTP